MLSIKMNWIFIVEFAGFILSFILMAAMLPSGQIFLVVNSNISIYDIIHIHSFCLRS